MWGSKKISIKLKELTPRRNISWTKKQIEMTSDVINSYDIKKGIISVSKNNEVLDGNHRYTILINHYGGEHEIEVKKRPFGRWFYVTRKVLGLLILSPIFIPYIIIYTLIQKNVDN